MRQPLVTRTTWVGVKQTWRHPRTARAIISDREKQEDSGKSSEIAMDWPCQSPSFDDEQFDVFQYEQGRSLAVHRSAGDEASTVPVTCSR